MKILYDNDSQSLKVSWCKSEKKTKKLLVTFYNVVQEVDVTMANPQVAVEELVRVGAVDGVGVVADHGPLLEASAFRALERDSTTIPVAQVINLKKKLQARFSE